MASSILPNVRQALITGGQFNSIIDKRTITVHQKGTSKGIDLLCDYCALGALLDSNECFDPPRCTPDTRAAIIEEILAWIYGGGDAASMAWLFGGAGAGKSALAQTIAEICQKEGNLVATFFFSRTSAAERSDGARLIPTLVFQLLEAFPDLRVYVEESIDKYIGIFSRAPRTHMDLLFVKPLISLKQCISLTPITSTSSTLLTPTPPLSLTKPKSHRVGFVAKFLNKFMTKFETEAPLPPPPSTSDIAANTNTNYGTILDDLPRLRLIVIDGLDECNGQDIQIELLRILASAIPLLPFPFRFLIASRPEGYITRTINYDKSFESLDVRRFDLGNDENADSDIRRFLIRGFQEIRRSHPLRSLLGPLWPSKDAIETLVLESSSHFIYAATAIKYIQYPRGRPDARLGIILGLSAPPTEDKPFAQLDALYTHIFMSMDKADHTTVKIAFGIFALASLPHFTPIATSPVKLEEYLGMQVGEINILLEPLLSLVVLPESREDNIVILHASLLEFLLDVSRSGHLHVDLEMARAIISNYLLKEISMYALDSSLLEVEAYQLTKTMMVSIFNFLSHCMDSRITDNVGEYLVTFPALYDLVLHRQFILKCLTEARYESGVFFCLTDVLERFLQLFDTKEIKNRYYWQTEHSKKIEQQLQSVHEGLGRDPYLLDDTAQESLFTGVTIQNRYRVYRALANLVMVIHGVEASSEILIEKGNSWFSTANIRLHLLVVFLPHMTHKDIKNCRMLDSFFLDEVHELHRVVQQRVEEYLQRIDSVAKPSELQECRERWKLVGKPLLV